MKILYRIISEDYQEARKLIRKSQTLQRVWRLMVKSVSFGLSAIGAIFLIHSEFAGNPNTRTLWLNFSPFFVFSAIFLLEPTLSRVKVARAYRKTPTLHREISADFSEIGSETVDSAGVKIVIPWRDYDGLFEGKRVFVLRGISKFFTVVPKANLSEKDGIELRNLFTQHIMRR